VLFFKVLTLSVYVDIDAVHLYRAGKASCWHAGVLMAAPTVKRWGVTATAFKNLNERELFNFWNYKIKIQNLNAKMISDDDGQWISNDNGQCPCGGICLSISTQTSATLCAIG
jgi:hypothetical protein